MSSLNPKTHFTAFRELVALLTRHRQLTWEMTRREVRDRYVGQVLGTLWAIVHPLILMIVYVFLFVVVLGQKLQGLPGLENARGDFTTYLLSGLVPWICLQDAMNRGCGAITSNANLVKQVVFPIEILPVKTVIASLIGLGVSLAFLTAYVLLRQGSVPWTFVLLPLLLFLQTLGMIGIGYFLAAVAPYFRDIKDFILAFGFVGLYLTPIVYLPRQVPGMFRPILHWNPFSYMVWSYQDAICFGAITRPYAWVVFTLLCLGGFYLGYRMFRKLKPMFGNVL